jgi:hypothetical protein
MPENTAEHSAISEAGSIVGSCLAGLLSEVKFFQHSQCSVGLPKGG